MLTQEQIFENKKRYLELLAELNIDLTELYKYLEGSEYFYQPASNQTHCAFNGGLVYYQLRLYDALTALCQFSNAGKGYTQEDIIKVTLFKDFYRGFMYTPGQGRTRQDGVQLPTYKTIEPEFRVTYGDIGISSYMMAKHFIEFTDEQAMCLIHAKSDGYTPDIFEIMKSYKLLTLLKMADLAVQYL